MTSPHRVSEQGTTIHHLVAPAARILAAAVILITGLGISAVFWKMPGSSEFHALCHDGVVDENLTAALLPSESNTVLAPDEHITLPALDGIVPVAGNGADKYTQVYPVPASLAALDAEQRIMDVASVEDEMTMPAVPQKFEPLRRVVVEKPIFVESVNREFQPQPASVSTAEKSEELYSKFQFAENIRADSEDSAVPTDPFSVVAAPAMPALQPLQLIRLDNGLTPLIPLRDSELQPFVTPSL